MFVLVVCADRMWMSFRCAARVEFGTSSHVKTTCDYTVDLAAVSMT